jgi:hypothetical protein
MRRYIDRLLTAAVMFGAFAICSSAQADPYPPVDQNRPPLVIKHHGIFYADGTIRTRSQQGTETSGSVQVPGSSARL